MVQPKTSVAVADTTVVARGRPLGRRTQLILFVATSLILAAIPLVPALFGPGMGKDYPLWYAVGRQVLTGGDLHALDGRRSFAFLYPPFAAILMAPLCLFGPIFSLVAIIAINLASWRTAISLSDKLCGERGSKAWWIEILPSVLAMPLIIDNFNLGQPSLLLLALMLAGLALLQTDRPWSAGAMFALATSLKAFPVAILPYLLWRRRWRAAVAMVVSLGIFLLLVPAPIRGFERNLEELKTWFNGMVLTANEDGFGQRPEQNWSWQNNSIVAVTHRLVRHVNAEVIDSRAKPIYVNILDLSYTQANLVLLAIAGLIGIGFCAVLPSERRRSPRSDAAEFALLISLMTIASPLARAYYFVWLLFPITVLVHRAALEPCVKVRRWTWSLLALAMGLFAISPLSGHAHWPQALGNWFWATAILALTLAWHLRRDSALGASAAFEGDLSKMARRGR